MEFPSYKRDLSRWSVDKDNSLKSRIGYGILRSEGALITLALSMKESELKSLVKNASDSPKKLKKCNDRLHACLKELSENNNRLAQLCINSHKVIPRVEFDSEEISKYHTNHFVGKGIGKTIDKITALINLIDDSIQSLKTNATAEKR